MLKYSDEYLRQAVTQVRNMTALMRYLGLRSYSGASAKHLKRRLERAGIDTSHWLGLRSAAGRKASNRLKPEEVLIYVEGDLRQRTEVLRRVLLEVGMSHQCFKCGQLPVWRGKPLVLHIDHKDGNWRNNKLENLRFLCPNCHSQTETWGYKTQAFVGESGVPVTLSR